ncbi:MAG TPA: GNAT family N-acetyltransferase [Pyrinomonadaceae bacterium]|nr:GNAT family N-acetyltransferase [Pyrinomonadaceae bacterium]
MNLTIRGGRPEDAEACGVICYEAFKSISDRHNFPEDFPSPDAAVGLMSMLLPRDDVYSVIAELDGRVVGSNFLWENAIISGVGPITIDPAVQNVAVGKQLMINVMQRARERHFAGIRLVQAAYHGRSLALYTKLGFDTREPLSTMQGPPVKTEIAGHTVRSASEADVDPCNQLCFKVHGHSRTRELRDAIKEGTATVVEHGGRITGYATLIGFFGHAVTETNEGLKALIAAAPEFPGAGFLLPSRNGEVFRWCLAHGLKVVQPMTLMSTGLYNEPAGAFMPSVIY